MSWITLPKFMICQPDQIPTDDERMFVMHTQTPRFLMEFAPGGEGELLTIDTPNEDAVMTKLKNEARTFFDEGS